MHLASIHVGLPRPATWQGRTFETGIRKSRVEGRVRAGPTGLEGDASANRRVHGGEFAAAYSYSAEHYGFWRERLGQPGLEPAAFGENLSTVGLDETLVCLGDTYRFGDLLLQATQPRIPCQRLAMVFDDPGMVEAFAGSLRWGVYWRILEIGSLGAGDTIVKVEADPARIPLSTFVDYEQAPVEVLETIHAHVAVHPVWRERIGKRLEELHQEVHQLPLDGTLDLHTFHPREVRDLVPAYLEACREAGVLEIRLIHGKGTGQLREKVHSVLRKLEGIAEFRLAEEGRGGWGATLVRLDPP